MTTIALATIIPFLGLFALFIVLGFYGKYWRRGNLNDTHEWSLAGRKLGTTLVFFLLGADTYTAYTFVAIPSTVFKFVALCFVFTIPATYAISLQLLGGILITQILPAVFFGLYQITKERSPHCWIASRNIFRDLYARVYEPLWSTSVVSIQYTNFWFIVYCRRCPFI